MSKKSQAATLSCRGKIASVKHLMPSKVDEQAIRRIDAMLRPESLAVPALGNFTAYLAIICCKVCWSLILKLDLVNALEQHQGTQHQTCAVSLLCKANRSVSLRNPRE